MTNFENNFLSDNKSAEQSAAADFWQRDEVTNLVLDTVVSTQIGGVELENHELEDSAISSHCLDCDRLLQDTERLGLTQHTHTQHTHTASFLSCKICKTNESASLGLRSWMNNSVNQDELCSSVLPNGDEWS